MSFNGQKVAVKYSELPYKQTKRSLDTCRREIECLCAIDHPNVVKLIAVGLEDDLIFTVMELASSITSWDFIKKVHLSWNDGVPPSCWSKIWSDLAKGCAAMSKAGIYHRDLTFDNVLLFLHQ